MDARASTSNPPPKFVKPFVPPSDSSRSQSFASSPIRTSGEGVPPTKKRRLASTPTSSSLSLSTPRSSSRPEQPALPDLHDARAASSMRVLNIWSALAERYNRRLDEDDIVDIRTGEVIKDRGVLNELPKRYNFGDLAEKDDDPAANTDPGSEAADNHAEDEEDDDNEDEDDAEETDPFPPADGLVASQITRLAPLRPATSSSDADDLDEFLKAEAIRRELDGGDDSSEDEFSILPPRSTPAKRTRTPARRPLRSLSLDTESEDEFAVLDPDRNDIHHGYRARRTPTPEVPASIPSPPPLSSSPGPSSSFSSPPPSRTPLTLRSGHQTNLHFGSPTPKRQPLASTSRRTLEDSLNEIDLEFPPPQPRAPSIFGRRPTSTFIIDLSLSDDETEDKRPHPPTKATTDPEAVPSEPRTVKKRGSTLISRKPTPFVLIETKRPVFITPASTTVASESSSTHVDPGPVTLSQPGTDHNTETSPKKGRPRTRSSKHKPPDLDGPQDSNREGGAKAKLLEGGSQEGDGDVLTGGSTSLRVDRTSKKVESPSPSPARSDPSPKVKIKPKRPPTQFTFSDEERSSGSESSPMKRIASLESSPGEQTQATTPKFDSKPRSKRNSAAKPISTRSTRSTKSGTSTTTAKPNPKTPRKPPEVSVDPAGDDRSSPSLPPSPSPAPPVRPRIRRALKRKRRISSRPSSEEERGSPKPEPGQRSSPPSSSRSQTCTIKTSEVINVNVDDHGDHPEADESKPQTRSQSRLKMTMEVGSTPVETDTVSVVTPSDVRKEADTPNRPDGSYTHFPSPPPFPVGFPGQSHQSFAHFSGHPPPFQDHAIHFNPVPYQDHGHGQYPFFQDPNTQALLAQAVTQLAVIMNGGRPPPQVGHVGGFPGNMPAMNGFPAPGWGMFPAWPPSTPTTSGYPYGHDHQQRSFQGSYVGQMRNGVGPSMPPSTQFPPSNTFPSSMSLPTTQETGTVPGRVTGARSRSKSNRNVSFVLDPRSGSDPAGEANDPGERSKRGTGDSSSTTRGRGRARGVGRGAPRSQSNRKGKSKADEADQGLGLDAGGSDEEGDASVDPGLSPRGRGRARGRKPGPGRR